MTPKPSAVPRPGSHHWLLWLCLGSAVIGLLLGLWQPLLLVAVGGFGIAAGPSYVGLVFALCLLVLVVDGIIAIVAPSSRDASGPIFAIGAVLALGMVGGNFIASSMDVSWAAPTPEPTPIEPAGVGWSRTGDMLLARHDHTAILLNDGRVLVAGGATADDHSDSRVTDSAELYDPRSGTWAATGSMVTPFPNAFSSNWAAVLNDGRVLVVIDTGQLAEIYDPATGAWRAAATLTISRGWYSATLLNDGKVLVAGGTAGQRATSSTELYDPTSGTWTTAAPMSSERSGHTATLLADGRVLIAGGRPIPLSPSDPELPVATAEVYDPATGTWGATGSMQEARAAHVAVLLQDGSVLVVGGSFKGDSAEVYDPSTGTWRAAAGSRTGESHQAILLADGRVMVIDSFSGLVILDPGAPSAEAISTSAKHGVRSTATLLGDGRVLFAGGTVLSSPGGYGLRSDVLASTHLFDPGEIGN